MRDELLRQDSPDRQNVADFRDKILAADQAGVARMRRLVVATWAVVAASLSAAAVTRLWFPDVIEFKPQLVPLFVTIFQGLLWIAVIFSISLYIRSRTLTMHHMSADAVRPRSNTVDRRRFLKLAAAGAAAMTLPAIGASGQERRRPNVLFMAIDELGKKHEKPFFLACGFFRPHLPWYVPRKYFDMYPVETVTLPNVKEDDLDDVPPIGRRMARPEGDHRKVIEHNQWRKAVRAYLALISFVDACVGRVLNAFDKSNCKDNTIIVLWSDHGWHLGEKLHWRKFSLWEEATHNVLMMLAPGVSRAGQRCPRPVTMPDFYPTLIDLCGLGGKPELEGQSLVPLLKNPLAEWERPALTTHGKDNHSLRSERWRYIRYRDGMEELYDHGKDGLEWHNLAAEPRYAEVKKQLSRWLPKDNAPEVTEKNARNRSAGEE